MPMETPLDRRDPTRGRSYKDSASYQRSHRMRHDGQPAYPLAFLDRPLAQSDAPKPKRRPRYGLAVALVACAAIAVVLERRR